MKVSLITTERNEAEDIGEFIDSALAQSLKPDEIIIADGGSTDGTVEIIQRYIDDGAPIKLVHAPGNRSVGRNAAIGAASHEVIACTDVGSRLDKDWLKYITQPFRDKPDAMVVSGFFLPEPKTEFERVSSTLMLQANDHIDLDTWLPSSRSIAYKKAAWQKAGGYPEHTNFNEDTPFDLALRAAGYKFEDGLKAAVYWRPRPNWREFYKQYYYYAVGDGIDLLNLASMTRLTIKYAGVVISLFLMPLVPWLTTLILAYYIWGLVVRSLPAWRKLGGLSTFGLMLLLAVTYDVSQICGYWYGYLNRRRLRQKGKLIR